MISNRNCSCLLYSFSLIKDGGPTTRIFTAIKPVPVMIAARLCSPPCVTLYCTCRQLVFPGGYTRAKPFARLLGYGGLDPSLSPMYSASHLRTSAAHLLVNTAMWVLALVIKFALDFFLIIKPAQKSLKSVLSANKLSWTVHVTDVWWPPGWSRTLRVRWREDEQA